MPSGLRRWFRLTKFDVRTFTNFIISWTFVNFSDLYNNYFEFHNYSRSRVAVLTA